MILLPILKYVVVSAGGDINEMPPGGAFGGIVEAAERLPPVEEAFPVVFEGGEVEAAEPEALPVGFAEPEPEAAVVEAAAVDGAALPSLVEAAADFEDSACVDFGF